MSGTARLQIRGLAKRFGGVVAVKNMSFDLNAGEIVGLIGPNGSGKSTVMSLIMGLARANAGTVTLDGVDVAGWPAHRIARAGISIVFQHSRPLQRQTVLENIKLALLPDSLLRLATAAAVTERARAIGERVGLGGVLDRHPFTLPFADLRRMEMAKAVARDPKVVLLDEPFAGLTQTEIATFSDLIRTFRDEGRAVLLVDHSVKSVAALADRVIAMYLGERIAEGSAADVMQNETVRRVYIGGSMEAVERRSGEQQGRRHAACGRRARRILRQGQGGRRRRVRRARKRMRVDRRPQRRRQDHVVQGDFRPGALSRRDPLRRPRPAQPLRRGDRPRRRGALSGNARIVRRHDGARESGSRRRPSRQSERARQLAWVFELFPILDERQGQAARTLSGGEQQMLALGRALMMQPRLLILDEPTLGLAPVILGQLSKAIERLRQTASLTLLLGEQNITFALPHSDRLYMLDHGRIAWQGDPARFAAEMRTGYL